MIIVNLKGGLGNQMFQYATGFAISIKNNVQLKLDSSGYTKTKSDTPRFYELKKFNISSQQAEPKETQRLKYPHNMFSKFLRLFNQKILKIYFVDYHPEILKKKNYYLDGFWQSEKNFLNVRETLLQEFTLKTESGAYKKALSLITSNSLSVHIRRGDYVSNQKTTAYHGVLDIEYYKKAFEILKSKIEQVVIFTDDPAWVKDNFDFIDKPTIFASDFNLSAPEELILMSKCSNNIIANSSFSWWGAWLNQNPDKIVIAPKIWFKKRAAAHKNITPETWMRI